MTARIRSIGVRYGGDRRTNDWYATHVPDALAAATERRLDRAFTNRDGDDASKAFDTKMARYLTDPFRGSTVRYKLLPEETSRTLEHDAAQDALAAAGLTGTDVDCILVASWLPEDFIAPGNAVFLARELGTMAPAFNIETACSSGLAGLEIAEGLLTVGRYRRVLLVLSNTVSRVADDANSLSWISSDTAAAVVLEAGSGEILGSQMENTAATADVFVHRICGDDSVRMELGEVPSHALRSYVSPEMIQRLCHAALDRARVRLEDIRYLACSTPLAWFSALCRDVLGLAEDRTLDLFPRLANAGLPFPVIHLHHAMHEERLAPGDHALIFTVGSTSSAGAMVVRAGDWALGPHPRLRFGSVTAAA